MFTWNIEELKLMNDNRNTYYNDNNKAFECEATTSREDKIDFIDNRTDGGMTYILDLIDKFEADKKSLPQNEVGDVKTVSLKAWLKRNDTRGIVDKNYCYGKLSFLRLNRRIYNNTKYNYETYNDIVDECFYRILGDLKIEEEEYFKTHDEYHILSEKVQDKCFEHKTIFDVKIIWNSCEIFISGDNDGEERQFTINELKLLLSKYDELEKFIKKLSDEVNIKY